MKKYWKQFILITILVGILVLPLFSQKGFPYTHDGQNHMARMANYYLALKQGQLPPRWAPNLDAGFGYTSLNFNYPLANILSIPFTVLDFRIDTTLKILFTLSLWFGGIGMYLFLKSRYGRISSMIASMAYIIAPYQLVNIYVRGNIGESMAFGILPWVLYFMANKKIKKKISIPLIISLSLFLLSHNLIAVLGIPFIIFIYSISKDRLSARIVFKSLGISLLLVSFFWIPALWEKQYIVLDQSPLSILNLNSHFTAFRQLISSAWDHGFSYPVKVDGMSFSIGLMGLIGLIFSFILFFTKKIKSYEVWVFSASMFLSLLTLSVSKWIWQIFPIASIIQFPWRMLFFVNVLTTILLAYAIQNSSKKIFYPLIILVIISTSRMSLAINFTDLDNHYWMSFPLNTTILNENDPIWLERGEAYELKESFENNLISSEELTLKNIISWNGTSRKYEIETKNTTTIVENTIYFPGWEAKIDGEKIDISQYKENYFGLINFEIPAGKHTIETKFTQNTPARIVGNTLSLVGIILLLYQIKQTKLQNKNSRNRHSGFSPESHSF